MRSEMGIGEIFGIAFIILKLMGYIGWSWWWVTAPFWIPMTLLVVIEVLLNIKKITNERFRNK